MFSLSRSVVFVLFVLSCVCLLLLSPVLMLAIGGAVAWTVAIASLAVGGISSFSLCVEP